MRITLTDKEKAQSLSIEILAALKTQSDLTKLKQIFDDDSLEQLELIARRIRDEYTKPISSSKRNATLKATDTRVKRAREKITNTVNLMRLEGKKINTNTVANASGVAYNTVKKYRYLFDY
jgi:hypothetical protein